MVSHRRLGRLSPAHLKRAALGLLLVVSLAGCVSIPSGGAVQSYSVTQGPPGQSHSLIQLIAPPPGPDWTPVQIVRGFLTASASIGDQLKIAREYLTPQANRDWKPDWSVNVYSKGGPSASGTALRKGQKTATVMVSGKVVAQLSGGGGYAVPSAPTPGLQSTPFELTLVGGQWRISDPPTALLLTSGEFQYDYQLRNLYFFDPAGRSLVPDPIYVPLQATQVDLMDELVGDLIKPPLDWLTRGATTTAFPPGTALSGDVTLDGETAVVNLRGKAIVKATDQVLEQVSGQLFSTLIGSGAGGPSVQSIELSRDGKAWSLPGTDGNPVQAKTSYTAPTGSTSMIYYLDRTGELERRDGPGGKSKPLMYIGPGYSQIAVSPDGKYIAVLRGNTLFAGPIGIGSLLDGRGSGFTSMSWGADDDLWTTTTADQIVMLHGDLSSGSWSSVVVSVVNFEGSAASGPYTAVRVAPDGVRVAVIVDGIELSFGAIVVKPPTRAGGPPTAKIQFSPFSVSAPAATFSAVTWYGPDNVIALSEPGPVVTEFPVNGGGSTTLQAEPDMQSVSASEGSPLLAGLPKGVMTANASLTGAWGNIENAYGISPVYPG